MTSKRTIKTLKKIARDTFMESDTRTRVSGDKKAYTRKRKHKKIPD